MRYLAQDQTQSIAKYRVFIDYCGIKQNIEEKCGGISIMKIFEDNVLNNFDKYFFSQMFVSYCRKRNIF